MYKVFINNKRIFLTDDFSKNFQIKHGLFYKYRGVEDLKELISFYQRLHHIKTLYLFYHDIEKLRESFRECFVNINAAGGLVKNKEGKSLFIKRRGKWDLPKGKLDKGETFQDAAIREVQEECGLSEIEINTPLLSTYHTYYIENQLILKKTFWFEMSYNKKENPKPQLEEDITEIKWFDKVEMPNIIENTYGSILDVMRYSNLVNLNISS